MNKHTLLAIAKNKLISEMLRDINPKLFNACEQAVQPMVTDLDLMPAVCNLISEVKPVTNENMAFYAAVLLRIFSPIHLHFTGMRLPNGFRSKFCEHFGYNDLPMWNHWAAPVRGHMKDSRFASAVNDCAFEIASILKTNGELLENNAKIAPSPQPSEKCEKMPSIEKIGEKGDNEENKSLTATTTTKNLVENQAFDPNKG